MQLVYPGKNAMRMAVNIVLEAKERQLLERLSRSRSTPVRLAERSKIVLLASAGKENGEIAEELGITRQKAGRWRDRYHRFGLAGIEKDAARPGRKKKLSSRKVTKVIQLTTQEKPKNATHWSRRLMAERMKLSESSVGRIWRAHGLKPHRVSGFKLSNDKQFQEKLEDVVGLYLAPRRMRSFSVVMRRARCRRWIEPSPACPSSGVATPR